MNNIFYTYEDLYNYMNQLKCGRVGLWALNNSIHPGHRKINDIVRSKCDFVVCYYHTNLDDVVESVTGLRRNKKDTTNPDIIYKDVVNEISKRSDAVLWFKDDYLGYDKEDKASFLKTAINQLPDNELPRFIHNDEKMYSIFRTCQVLKIELHQYFDEYYQIGSNKDIWRKRLIEWVNDYYPKVEYEIINPVLDEYGNSLSSSTPESIKKYIDRTLLTKNMSSIYDVQKNVDNLGIKVTYFYVDIDNKFMNARMEYDGKSWIQTILL